LKINTSGVYLCVSAFLELLAEGNKKNNVEQLSQVIAITSVGAFNRVPLAGFAYGASKAGTTHMMKQLATALVPYDIRSNMIAPGSMCFLFLFEMRGMLILPVYPSEMSEGARLDAIIKHGVPKSLIPMQRLGSAEDMAGTILFLTSKAGAYLNGNVLVSDGGRLGVLPSSY